MNTASDLREWIALFLPELVPDGQGGARESIPVGLTYDRPAAVREVSGTEIFTSEQTAQRVRYEVIIRYDLAITPAYRVWWRDTYLDILNVKNVDMHDMFLQLECMQREAGKQ